MLDAAPRFAPFDIAALALFLIVWLAYEQVLKAAHSFNLLDARGAISVTERVGVMARIRTLVVGVAKAYAAQGAALQGAEIGPVAG